MSIGRRELLKNFGYAAVDGALAGAAAYGLLYVPKSIHPARAEVATLYCPPAVIDTKSDGKFTDVSQLKRTVIGLERQDLQIGHEYGDAREVDLVNAVPVVDKDFYTGIGNIKAYVKYNVDKKMLNVLMDCLSHLRLTWNPKVKLTWNFDVANVFLDLNNDHSETPQSDDCAYQIIFLSGRIDKLIYEGKNNTWGDAKAASGLSYSTDASNDPISTNPHVICEFNIPFDKKPERIGFGLDTRDVNNKTWMVWPPGFDHRYPNTWGELAVLDKPSEAIPEFSSILTPAAIAIGTGAISLYRRCKR